MGNGIGPAPFYHHDIMAAEVRQILGDKDDPVIVEVGCNDGETTLGFLAAMPKADIYCFEPDPRPLARHRCRGMVRLFNVAISDRDGEAMFYQSGGEVANSKAPCAGDWDYSGSIHRPTGHLDRDKQVQFPSTITVRTCRLDGFSVLPASIDLIFADVQGAEARLILGAQETLRRTHWLYIEFYDVEQYDRQPDLKGLLSFLPDFDLVARYADNALLKNRTL